MEKWGFTSGFGGFDTLSHDFEAGCSGCIILRSDLCRPHVIFLIKLGLELSI